MLSVEQRRQARKDLIWLKAIDVKMQANPVIPQWIKTTSTLQMRLIETLAINAAIFSEVE